MKYCESKHIKNQTRKISSERLNFKDEKEGEKNRGEESLPRLLEAGVRQVLGQS